MRQARRDVAHAALDELEDVRLVLVQPQHLLGGAAVGDGAVGGERGFLTFTLGKVTGEAGPGAAAPPYRKQSARSASDKGWPDVVDPVTDTIMTDDDGKMSPSSTCNSTVFVD